MNVKIFSIFIIGFLVFGSTISQEKKPLVRTIVIDPGHGGEDAGALGTFSSEKDIALALSLKVYHQLVADFPNKHIIITRQTDVYNTVKEKAEIANKAKGDLFICIHVNSAGHLIKEKIGERKIPYYVTIKGKKVKKTKKRPVYRTRIINNPEPYGTSTYIWSNKKTDQKNDAIINEGLGDEQDSTSNIPDLNTLEAHLLSQAYTQKYFTRSKKMADLVEEEFVKIGRNSRGVKQRDNKGIWVLQQTTMPAILIETGFISNPAEEQYLNSEEGQEQMATAIVTAIKKYINTQENNNIGDSSKNILMSQTPQNANKTFK